MCQSTNNGVKFTHAHWLRFYILHCTAQKFCLWCSTFVSQFPCIANKCSSLVNNLSTHYESLLVRSTYSDRTVSCQVVLSELLWFFHFVIWQARIYCMAQEFSTIMLNPFRDVLRSKLCRYNQRVPKVKLVLKLWIKIRTRLL